MSKSKVVNTRRHVNLYIDEQMHNVLVKMAATRQLQTGQIVTVSELVREALAQFTNVNIVIGEK